MAVVEKLLNNFLSHTESTEFTDFSLLCDACAGINAADARGIHRDLTITNANTAPAESNTFTMATVHFVPLRQVGRAKRRGWIKKLSVHTFQLSVYPPLPTAWYSTLSQGEKVGGGVGFLLSPLIPLCGLDFAHTRHNQRKLCFCSCLIAKLFVNTHQASQVSFLLSWKTCIFFGGVGDFY